MFGSSKHNNEDNQHNDMQNFGGQAPNDVTAPSLPSMGGQNSPFGPAPQPAPVAPAPAGDPLSGVSPAHQPHQPQQHDDHGRVPHHEDTEHMVPDHGTPDSAHHTSGPGTGQLVDIKQKALSQLSPLVSHLDQTAEEKFRTTMMMIQATDDQSLLKEAYDAAEKIEDEKVRAQALLDVINEINYFTQNSK